MGGREENPDPALQSIVTGVYIPSAEGGTAFFSPRLPPLFLFACILAIRLKELHNEFRIKLEVKILWECYWV